MCMRATSGRTFFLPLFYKESILFYGYSLRSKDTTILLLLLQVQYIVYQCTGSVYQYTGGREVRWYQKTTEKKRA